MTETLEGSGVLTQENSPTRWAVNYVFHVYTRAITKTGFPRVRGKSEVNGRVESINGESLPLGIFQLTAQDVETLRIQNLGVSWTILAA